MTTYLKNNRSVLPVVVLLALVAALLVNAQSVPASYGPPTMVPYSGHLRLNAAGVETDTDVIFFLVDASTKGYADAMWQETHSLSQADGNLSGNGNFSVMLGSVTPFAAGTFERAALYLGMVVDGNELGGLQRLARTPYTVQSAQSYDAFMALHGVPAGTVVPYAGSTAPAGWVFADGGSLSTATYADLFAAVGYTYGGSGGSFNVPDMRNRYPIGSGNGVNNGQAVGTNNNSWNHTHGAGSYGAHVSLSWTSGTSNKLIFDKRGDSFTADRHVGAGTFTEAGLAQGGAYKTVVSGTSSSTNTNLDNRPASLGLRYIVKT
jgi:microcystin-dependent protein